MDYRAVIIAFTIIIPWSTQQGTIPITVPTEGKEQFASAINEFGFNLMMKMMKEKPNTNVVISPTGVAGLLAMTLLGSVGATYDELAKVLGFSQDVLENRKIHERFGSLLKDLSKENVDLDLSAKSTNNSLENDLNITSNAEETFTKTLYADAIVVDEAVRIRQIFRNYLERVYHGDAITNHFGDGVKSRKLINEWVSNHTAGRIDEFLNEPLPSSTKAVLLNALFFSGQWARPFIPQYTANMTFHSPTGNKYVELMLNSGSFKYAFKKHGANIIALPYKDNTTTMYVLKTFHWRSNLTDVLENLNFTIIDEMIDKMKLEECVIRFPKMNLKTKADLKRPLKELGINSVFSPGEANFALMVDVGKDDEVLTRILEGRETRRFADVVKTLPNPGLHIDSVLHDVLMTIDEFGTVAASASGGVLSRSARLFYADSPFFMFIRNERTKLVTFSAIIYDPSATS